MNELIALRDLAKEGRLEEIRGRTHELHNKLFELLCLEEDLLRVAAAD